MGYDTSKSFCRETPAWEALMGEWKNTILRCLLAVGGLVLFAFGTYLAIRGNVGLAPWDALNQGLSLQLPISYGTASVVVSVLIIGVDLLLGERIGLGTILDAFIVGKTVDLFQWLDFIPQQNTFGMGVILLVIGMFLEALGQYLYMRAALCCGPRDALLVGLGKRVPKVPIGGVNIVLLVVVLAIAWVLGGSVGWGTLIAAVGIGVCQQIVFRLLRFEPRNVVHENLLQTIKRLGGKKEAQG